MKVQTLSLKGMSMSFHLLLLLKKILLLFLLLGIGGYFSTLSAQTGDPCSVNVGEPIEICFDDAFFQLNGILGSNVNAATVQWSTNASGFDINDPNDPNSLVTPDPMGSNFPTGVFTFYLEADCLGGQSLLDSVQIFVEAGASQATILANGLNVSDITVCNEVTLTHLPLNPGEVGCWSYFFTDPDVIVTQGGCTETLIVNVNPTNADPCKVLEFYFTVENGGCVTEDKVTVNILGQDEDVRFIFPQDNVGFCTDGEIGLGGSTIGCSGNYSLQILEYPSIPPVILDEEIQFKRVRFTLEIFESGWYSFIYQVDPIPGAFGCQGGADTVRVYYCLSDPEISSSQIRECGIPDQADLESPFNPNYTYSEWIWNGNPNPSVDPVITYPDPGNLSMAEVTINDTAIEQYTFTQNIIVDSCIIEREMQFTFGCPGYFVFEFPYQDLLTGENLIDTLIVIECDGDVPDLITFDPEYICELEIEKTPDCTESAVCFYDISFIWKQPNPCFVQTTYVFNQLPEVKDTTVNLLCGGIPNFQPWDYYPELNSGSFSLEVLQVPAGHPSLSVGQNINGTSATLNLSPLGVYVFEMELARGACEDIGIMTVNVDDISIPVAPAVADFCVGDTVELVGSIPDNPAAQIAWIQLDNNPPLIFLDPPNITNPSITATAPGEYILEYSFSRDDDCYLADTVSFKVDSCGTGNDCLLVMVDSVLCINNGTADPSDDQWIFSMFVDGGTTFWNASAPVNESGGYGNWKTIWMGPIAGYGSTINFEVSDDLIDTCTTDVVVDVPNTCSVECDLEVDIEVGECDDNGTPYNATDDVYKVSITVTGTSGQCWMAKRKNEDGSEELLGSFTGDQTVTLGPFDISDGDWTLWVFICDQFDCLVDFYIQAPDACSHCHQVEILDVQCLNGGTSTPFDDHWTFDILVNGGVGTYFNLSAPVPPGQSGSYGVPKTVWMGNILSYGSTVTFDVIDNLDPECTTPVTLQVPATCSPPCDLTTSVLITECKQIEGQDYYNIILSTQGTGGNCWMAKRKNADGSETILGTYFGDQTVVLGPFPADEDGWTLWVFLCEQMDCLNDFYISPPDCKAGEGEKFETTTKTFFGDLKIQPNPAKDVLNVLVQLDDQFDQPNNTATMLVQDLLGNVMIEKPLASDLTYQQVELLVTDWPQGVYFVSLFQAGKKVVTQRLLIQR